MLLIPKYGAVFFLFLTTFISLQASNETQLDVEKCSRIQIGSVFGGQEKNEFGLSNPGFSFNHVYSLKPNDRVGFGFGIGILALQKINFVPLYLSFIGFLSEHKPYFIDFQGGYSVGWRTTEDEGDYSGGPYLTTGLGRKFRFNSGFSLYLLADYKHQFAHVKYNGQYNPSYRKTLNYNFLVITLGIMLEKK